jgi:hypothetical protein
LFGARGIVGGETRFGLLEKVLRRVLFTARADQ